ncbi:MAG TPA: CDP-diacylglycerol--serine O-phosphatidyltransferase [bacterium]|nr:CDP-diacylglycerol--serine O-phosphatidyltransferase [bacterium]
MRPFRDGLKRPLKPKRYRGAHLLPNLLTCSSIACGLLAIVYTMDGKFELASWMILVAFVFDGLDGKVAKLFKVSSPLGVELDSLGDVISFGVAPSLLLGRMLYPAWQKLGISLILVYVLCTALRLARYNVMAHTARRPHFTGLPCPAAAGLLTSLVLMLSFYNVDLTHGGPLRVGMHILTIVLAVLMVSRIRYVDLAVRYVERGSVFNHSVILALALGLGALHPQVTLFCCFAGYIILGPLPLLKSGKVKVEEGAEQELQPTTGDIQS